MKEIESLNFLREKEDEMDKLLHQTRLEAEVIKKEAVKTTEEMKKLFFGEMERLKEKYLEDCNVETVKETAEIKMKARKEVEDIKKKALQRIDRAVGFIMESIVP